ncbi:Uma2 family endonuclease [Paludisphaera rhizosphaerae]|uniref:Uma2 family endonuclease n=1 Tax=Paludisphaera rhizosphaerae TaxID=2711216 RepID=UPI0013ED451C|nr:Uma2 family endonuclease [Paludisphaera rhizosphaerae]
METLEPKQEPITAEEFYWFPDTPCIEELVRGRVVSWPLPGMMHGLVCVNVGTELSRHVRAHDLGRVLSRSGLITERNPDTVRGPDVTYYSYAQLPRGKIPDGYSSTPPELVCEVFSWNHRWVEHLEKTAEYLKAGVLVVLILDADTRKAHIFEADKPPIVLNAEDVLRFESILPGFEVVVGRLFA